MDGFSYHNIFETKGIEYLIIIAFLILIVPFWFLMNRKVTLAGTIRNAADIISGSIPGIPMGLLFSRNHTWTHLGKSGVAEVGIDDFLLRVTGKIRITNIKQPGSVVKIGEPVADLEHDGKTLRVLSPVSGKIEETNRMLSDDPATVASDPYNKGWFYRISPLNWNSETGRYYLAEEARRWYAAEIARFRDFIAESVRRYTPLTEPAILQDGGEIYGEALSDLPAEVWQDFQKSFLNMQG